MTRKSQTKANRNRARKSNPDITRQIMALIPADEEGFSVFEQGFIRSLKPIGPVEIGLVSAIARGYWDINAISAAEQNFMAAVHELKYAQHTIADSPETQAAVTRARIWLDGCFSPAIPLIQLRIQRTAMQNLDLLDQAQASRRSN